MHFGVLIAVGMQSRVVNDAIAMMFFALYDAVR